MGTRHRSSHRLRAPNDAQQRALGTHLQEGHHVSPVMDRAYFHWIYFREPGSICSEMTAIERGLPQLALPQRAGVTSS
jgi:hypothetical protein